MGHIFCVRLRSSKRLAVPRTEHLADSEALSLFLDDASIVEQASALLGTEPSGYDDPSLYHWLKTSMPKVSAQTRQALLTAIGFDDNLQFQFQEGPNTLEEERDLERAFVFWILHGLSDAPTAHVFELEFDVEAFGQNGIEMLDLYLQTSPWLLASWATRLAVELAAAAGHEQEDNPIRWYFEDAGAAWPDLSPRDDSADGIIWAVTGQRLSKETATLRFLIHPAWLPAQTDEAFESWA
jgi:hypothetical protein